MPSNPPTPTAKSVSQIKAALLHPATTSHFIVNVQLPTKLTKYFAENSISVNSINLDRLNLMCCEATLPGSNLATLEVTNDFHGVTERHAYRRVYDDRIDLTFYVDAEHYLPIRIFETWMKYIAQESSDAPQPQRGDITSKSSNYFYRFQYPDSYTTQGLSITKFERSSMGGSSSGGRQSGILSYEFIRSYPISITSMPISYDSSSLLKCTVSMTYIRYVLNKGIDPPLEDNNNMQLSPLEQASWNSAPDYLVNPQFGIQGQNSGPVFNDFLNGDTQKDGRAIGNPALDQFRSRDQIGRDQGIFA